MDQRTGQIVSEILEERQRLGGNIAELEHKVRAASWQSYFARKPWALLGLAVGGGFLLSALLLPRRR
jgi:ElaB/YqjD/DUF883 family membrane-anchored ribosome-binding protein